MEYRTLGRTGLRVSVFTVGTWQLGGPMTLAGKADAFPDPGREAVVGLLRACGDLGINVVDSAEIYGDGEAERRIGEALQGVRDQWIVSTKFGMRRGSAGERIVDASPGTIRSSLENSLRRLQTDYVDMYLYHAPPDPRSAGEGHAELEKLKKEGKIRFHGISTNSPAVFDLVTKDPCAADVAMFSQSLATHPAGMIESAARQNLGVLVRGGLESGRLSGAYFNGRGEFQQEDIRRQNFSAADLSKYAVFDRLRPANASMVAFALRYLLDFKTTHTIVLGGKSIEQYRSALDALELPPLDEPTRQAIASTRRTLIRQPLAKRVFGRLRSSFRQLAGRG